MISLWNDVGETVMPLLRSRVASVYLPDSQLDPSPHEMPGN